MPLPIYREQSTKFEIGTKTKDDILCDVTPRLLIIWVGGLQVGRQICLENNQWIHTSVLLVHSEAPFLSKTHSIQYIYNVDNSSHRGTWNTKEIGQLGHFFFLASECLNFFSRLPSLASSLSFTGVSVLSLLTRWHKLERCLLLKTTLWPLSLPSSPHCSWCTQPEDIRARSMHCAQNSCACPINL